ncbi:hypothetical protein ACLB2K_007961 [Fragaria x ananassa]
MIFGDRLALDLAHSYNWPIKVFAGHKELLDSLFCGVVVVSTPNMSHHHILMDIINHPTPHHVLVEKPLCTTIAHCKEYLCVFVLALGSVKSRMCPSSIFAACSFAQPPRLFLKIDATLFLSQKRLQLPFLFFHFERNRKKGETERDVSPQLWEIDPGSEKRLEEIEAADEVVPMSHRGGVFQCGHDDRVIVSSEDSDIENALQ